MAKKSKAATNDAATAEVTGQENVEQQAAAPEPKPARDKQNGITRPLPDSVTGKLWAIADRISGELQRPAPRKDVVAAYKAEVPNANEATAHTQYARWVVFNGAADALKEARAESAREKVEAKEKARAEKTAERERKAQEKAAAAAAKAAPAEGAPAAA